MTSNRRGAHFERLVAAVRQMLAPDAKVAHDITIPGLKSGEPRQVDVAVHGVLDGKPAVVVVECKEHTRRIEIGRVDAFVGFLDDIGATAGIMVTTAGFSKAALRRAQTSNIETWVLRPAADIDWEGYLRSLALRVVSRGTVYRDCAIELVDGRVMTVSPVRILHDPGAGKDVFFDRIMNYALRDGFEDGSRVEARLQDELFAEVDGELVKVAALVATPSEEDLFTSDAIWERPEDWVYFRETPQGSRKEKEFFESRVLKGIAESFKRPPMAAFSG